MTSNEGYRPPENQDNGWMVIVFWIGITLAVLLGCAAFQSCGVTKYVDRWHTEYRDTTIVKEHTHDSLVYVPVPLEANQVIVQLGDTSRLKTSVAHSEAFVGGDGFLHHSLENNREKLPVLVPIKTSTIYTGVTSNQTQTITKVEYRDKPLTWWQSFRIRAFWWLLGICLVCLCWIFRKPLIKLLPL